MASRTTQQTTTRYTRALVALDGSPASAHVLEWARAVAKVDHAELVVASVLPVPTAAVTALPLGAWTYHESFEAERVQARAIVESAIDAAVADGLPARGVLASGPAAGSIIELARRERADLVIVGSHERNAFGRLIWGSVADSVKRHAHADLLIARNTPPPKRVVVATDGSVSSLAAGLAAGRLAAAWHADLTVLHAMDRLGAGAIRPRPMPVPEGVASVSFVTSQGAPAETILAAAREAGVGLLALGTRGAVAGLSGLGRVSDQVAHHANCSVLLCRGRSR